MEHDAQREVRLFFTAMSIVVGYGAFVTLFAAARGQLGLIHIDKFGGVMASIWTITLCFVFISYALELVLKRRPERPLAVLAADLRANVLRRDLFLARFSIVAGWFCLMLFFTPFKVMIGHVRGFPLDQPIAQFERALFLGSDPWELTHFLFGSPAATMVIQSAYSLWYGLMWLSIIYFMLRPERAKLRAQYLLAFLLSWIFVGSVAAYLLGSAGPCFYEQAIGGDDYRPLLTRLAEIDQELKSFWHGLGVHSLGLQNMLWYNFVAKTDLFGGGISAMPSMHVSIAVLLALVARNANPKLGGVMTGYAVLIWIGSVHLGWHYALDGVVAFALTLGIWKVSGWLVERVVFGEAPAAALQPALAE